MKLNLTLTLITTLLAVQAMDQKPPHNRHDPSDHLRQCRIYMARVHPAHVWTEGQLRICIQAAVSQNDTQVLDAMLRTHVKSLRYSQQVADVEKIIPNMIVASCTDNGLPALGVLLTHHEMSFDTLKAAFIRAAVSNSFRAVHLLANTASINSPIGTEAIKYAYSEGHFRMAAFLLNHPNVKHDPDDYKIIQIKEDLSNLPEPQDETLDPTDQYKSDMMQKLVLGTPDEEPEVKNDLTVESFEQIENTPGEPSQGWFWDTFYGLARMVTNVASSVYNGISAKITFAKKDEEELYKDADK